MKIPIKNSSSCQMMKNGEHGYTLTAHNPPPSLVRLKRFMVSPTPDFLNSYFAFAFTALIKVCPFGNNKGSPRNVTKNQILQHGFFKLLWKVHENREKEGINEDGNPRKGS